MTKIEKYGKNNPNWIEDGPERMRLPRNANYQLVKRKQTLTTFEFLKFEDVFNLTDASNPSAQYSCNGRWWCICKGVSMSNISNVTSWPLQQNCPPVVSFMTWTWEEIVLCQKNRWRDDLMAYTLDCSLADSGTSLCQVVVLGISAKKFHSRNREDDLGSVVTDDEQAFHLKKTTFSSSCVMHTPRITLVSVASRLGLIYND